MFFINQQIFLQNTKPLYPNPKTSLENANITFAQKHHLLKIALFRQNLCVYSSMLDLGTYVRIILFQQGVKCYVFKRQVSFAILGTFKVL